MALSNAEKQAQWRARRQQRIRVLEWRVVELLEENIKLLQENERLRNQAASRSNQ
jgi:regulator of replication initiation timing